MGLGDGDGHVADVEPRGVVVTGDRQSSVCGKQDVLAHVEFMLRVVLEQFLTASGTIEWPRASCPSARPRASPARRPRICPTAPAPGILGTRMVVSRNTVAA